jgi:DNA-binding NtrC family response regulator
MLIAGDEPNETDAVLLLENDETTRNILGKALFQRSYRVILAEDVFTALTLAGDHNGVLHAFVADMSTLYEDAQIVLASIRRFHPNVKVLLTAPDRGAVLRDRLLAPGVSCLEKPFSVGLLAHTIAAMLKTEEIRQDSC